MAASEHMQALSCFEHILKFWPKFYLDVVNKNYVDIWEQNRSDLGLMGKSFQEWTK